MVSFILLWSGCYGESKVIEKLLAAAEANINRGMYHCSVYILVVNNLKNLYKKPSMILISTFSF